MRVSLHSQENEAEHPKKGNPESLIVSEKLKRKRNPHHIGKVRK
jgi:hypothetical protein